MHATIRKPGYLTPGPSLTASSRHRRVNTPKRSPVRKHSVPFFLSILTTLVSAASASGQTLAGRVVDPSGVAVPRAYVRVIDADGKSSDGTFSEADGRFRLTSTNASCRVEVSLAGFETARVPCSAQPIDVKLTLAPVHETIAVSATRSEAPVSQLGASVTVFDAADLERRQSPPVADLLTSSPGVAIARTGGYGSVTSLFVRGGESSYNKVLLDGIPLNEPGGTFNFSNVTSENLERVEIVRGAQSALFGSDAMASVVQLITRRGRPGSAPRGDASVEGGSYGTGRARVSVAGSTERADYSAAAAWLTTDNRADNNAFENTTLSATGGIQLGAAASLRGVVRGELGKAGAPGATAFGRADSDAFFRRHDGVGGMTFLQNLGAGFSHRATYALSVSHQASTNLHADAPYTPRFGSRSAPFQFSDFLYDSHTDLRRHYATYQADWRPETRGRFGDHQVTTALDWDGERGTLTNVLAGTATVARRDNVGWTLQHQALWPRLFVTGSLRVERNDSFGTATVPRVSAALVVRESQGALGETRLKASAGRGIKEPTILQSYSPSPSFLGNPDLLPERSRSIDAGIEQRLAHDRLKVEATWFDGLFRNIISTRTLSFNPYRSQYFNIGETRAHGLELAADAAPATALRFRGGYTFMPSRVTRSTSPGSVVFAEGQWLFRRPRHAGYAEASWAAGPASISVIGTFVGRRVDSDFAALDPPINANDGHTTWDVRASYRLSRRLSLTAAGDNIAGSDYMDPLGYPALGRAIRAGVRVSF
jgi:outer membrane cobalamin receptor